MKAKAFLAGWCLGTLCILPGCHLWRRTSPSVAVAPEPPPAPGPLEPAPPEPLPEPPPPLPPPDPPVAPARKVPTARAVPGKPGYVFSPFNNKIIDVKDFASGALVADPTYPAAERMHFRVP